MTRTPQDRNADGFWAALDRLVAESTIRIDRPKGTAHPRYPEFVYPFDYGYLEGTRAGDGHGIDVWRGSLPADRVTGIVCTVTLFKRDSEIKLLLGCTPDEADTILAKHKTGTQSAILVRRTGGT